MRILVLFFLHVIFVFSFSSCLRAKKISENNELNGKVYFIEELVFKPEFVNGGFKNGDLKRKTTCAYDKKGNQMEWNEYHESGILFNSYSNIYDKKFCKIISKEHFVLGDLKWKIFYD